MNILSHPPPGALPSTSDAFIEAVFGIKLKDDDIRKQRTKLEQQVKRRTQGRTPLSTPGQTTISLPKS